MSDAVSKTRSFTIRLTQEDQADLAQLCALYGLDRPNSLRRAMRHVLVAQAALPTSGCFRAIGQQGWSPLAIRFCRKDDHE